MKNIINLSSTSSSNELIYDLWSYLLSLLGSGVFEDCSLTKKHENQLFLTSCRELKEPWNVGLLFWACLAELRGTSSQLEAFQNLRLFPSEEKEFSTR